MIGVTSPLDRALPWAHVGAQGRGWAPARWDMLRSMRIASAAAFVLAPLLALTGCEEPPADDTHGYVEVKFARASSETENPYNGTSQVQIQMAYGDCYQQFYAANPNWAIDGEDGALVFGTEEDGGEGWGERLCTEDVGGRAECEVTEIQQLLEGQAQRLSVTYTLTGPLESRVLLFGPLPLRDMTACDGGFAPRVAIENGGTRGLDANGNQVWQVLSTSTTEVAPGDALTINGAR